MVKAVREVADASGVAPAQVALAWVCALDVTLTPGQSAILDRLGSQVAGARY